MDRQLLGTYEEVFLFVCLFQLKCSQTSSQYGQFCVQGHVIFLYFTKMYSFLAVAILKFMHRPKSYFVGGTDP